MRRIPSFSALRAFEAAARLGGFALAAEALHLTPSAVSHQVKSLERHFGRALFVRRHRSVALTEDGARLCNSLSDAFDAIESACAALRPQPGISTLSVHCTPSFASQWLGPRLPSFITGHASVRLQFSSSADVIDLLRRGDLDMTITYGRPPSQAGVVVESLGLERIAALCAPALAKQLPPGQVGAWNRVALIESVLSPISWEDWFALAATTMKPPRSRSAFDRGALAVSAAVQGLGVALETTRFAEAELARGALVEPAPDAAIHREVHFLCYRESDQAQRATRAFRAWLLAETQAG